ncbi:NAD(P)-binding protein [Pholiota conissans]|uniref:NAD(P)-binding protein n=1 Tax=Pholiota conissans TaxID=109636 RepID=A0A9P5YVR4_9AGAR|nr:NAD(P)-binding protein [Pholiota conissans]
MSTSLSQVYFVSGANRGIGLALVSAIASKHIDAFVYAGVRNPCKAVELYDLVAKHPSRIEVVEYISSDGCGNQEIADRIQYRHGRVDVVIANAAISKYIGPVSQIPIEEFQDHFNVNVGGPLILFQSMLPLLKQSQCPKFIPISSAAASLTAYMDIPIEYTCYGVSKAALNWLARKIHFENPWLICFPLSPGVVNTDMVKQNIMMDRSGALAALQTEKEIPVETAARLAIDIINGSSREKESGEFMSVDGTRISW